MPILNVATAQGMNPAIPKKWSGVKSKLRSKKLKQKMSKAKTKGTY